MSLDGITRDPIYTFGCFTIPVGINKRTFKAKFFVCGDEFSLRADCIIGRGLLLEQDADLLLSEGCLRTGCERMPITKWEGRQRPVAKWNTNKTSFRVLEAEEGNVVSLIEEVVLPPWSECALAGKYSMVVPPRETKVVEVCGLGMNGLTVVFTLVVT